MKKNETKRMINIEFEINDVQAFSSDGTLYCADNITAGCPSSSSDINCTNCYMSLGCQSVVMRMGCAISDFCVDGVRTTS